MTKKEERAQCDKQMYAIIDRFLERVLGRQEELEPLTLEQGDEPEKEGRAGVQGGGNG